MFKTKKKWGLRIKLKGTVLAQHAWGPGFNPQHLEIKKIKKGEIGLTPYRGFCSCSGHSFSLLVEHFKEPATLQCEAERSSKPSLALRIWRLRKSPRLATSSTTQSQPASSLLPLPHPGFTSNCAIHTGTSCLFLSLVSKNCALKALSRDLNLSLIWWGE